MTGNVPDVPSDPVALTNDPLAWPDWLVIDNHHTTIPWSRPNLWPEVLCPVVLAGTTPLLRYIAFLYYTIGCGDRKIGRLLGLDWSTIHDIRQELKTRQPA